SEAKFRTLVEQSLTGVYIIQDDRFVYVNPGLSTIFGYSPEELRHLNLLDIVREDDRARVAENLRKQLDNEAQSLHYSFRARHKDGRRLEVEVLGSRTELNGRPAVIGTALDVTARKQAEEQQYRLAAEKDHLIERLQLHFNAMPIGCIVTAPDMTVLDWNPAAESIFGFSHDEMVGHPPYGRIIPATSRDSVERFVGELLRGNKTRSRVDENETKDGRRIFCEWHDTPLRDESGLVIGVIAMVQNVTERIKTEAALRELSARLLAAQDEERRRIARELHDNTAQQLAALALNLSVIAKLVVNPPPKVERILADTIRLVETTAQEVRTTSYLLHPPLLEAAGLVGAVRDYASGFAKRSGIKIHLELPEDLGRLAPEAELALFRMVQEGLGNIHRHSGSPTATIRLARETDRVSLEMKDAGHGIPAETLAALQSKTGAVGVGIAGMRERLLQLKGGLEIESGPGGTTVRATLAIGETKQTT
ncbi:MAG TPA: PAS domain S-box protein, partial [Verrucomicrobiae bacterium]|nr:PAS domain S-box protein [Verrucomicrobiae bacterium]